QSGSGPPLSKRLFNSSAVIGEESVCSRARNLRTVVRHQRCPSTRLTRTAKLSAADFTSCAFTMLSDGSTIADPVEASPQSAFRIPIIRDRNNGFFAGASPGKTNLPDAQSQQQKFHLARLKAKNFFPRAVSVTAVTPEHD